jgi:hypothetical protein
LHSVLRLRAGILIVHCWLLIFEEWTMQNEQTDYDLISNCKHCGDSKGSNFHNRSRFLCQYGNVIQSWIEIIQYEFHIELIMLLSNSWYSPLWWIEFIKIHFNIFGSINRPMKERTAERMEGWMDKWTDRSTSKIVFVTD